MAKKEGWFDKPGSKWKTMPNQMLRYRAAAFWQRVYCPEISMGLMTSEEAEDIDNQPQSDYRSQILANANKETISMTDAPAPQEEAKPSVPAPEQPLQPSDEFPDFMRG